MEIVLVLIPLSLFLLTIAVIIFRWAVKSGQYDDLDSPAYRILYDDDLAEPVQAEPLQAEPVQDQDDEHPTDERRS